jgi:hypothetical protein
VTLLEISPINTAKTVVQVQIVKDLRKELNTNRIKQEMIIGLTLLLLIREAIKMFLTGMGNKSIIIDTVLLLTACCLRFLQKSQIEALSC